MLLLMMDVSFLPSPDCFPAAPRAVRLPAEDKALPTIRGQKVTWGCEELQGEQGGGGCARLSLGAGGGSWRVR